MQTQQTRTEHAGENALARSFEIRGDECVYAADLAQAKLLYGCAIDAFLEGREFNAALRACRKLIRVAPDVVRTRCTLAFLLIGQKCYREAREQIDEYARLVRSTGTADFAIPRLQLLAHVTSDAPTREAIAARLAELGAEDSELAATAGATDDASIDWRERWERLLPIILRIES